MRPTLRLWLTGFLLLPVILLHAGPKPTIEKQPAWVTPMAVNYAANALDDEAEDGYADLLHEQQVSLGQQAVYIHKAMHILTEAGSQNLSQVAVEFDPAYQHLAFHFIRLVRNGKVINQLNLSRIKTIQQEKDLDRHIYDGSLTAVLFLEDLRKDDVLEYSYTLRGFNPIFQNRYAAAYELKFSVPVYALSYRLLVPRGRTIQLANSFTSLQPRISETATETVYAWTLENEEALPMEQQVPSWHDAYPMVMASEFPGWKEVADWATALFPFNNVLTGAVKAKVDEIRKREATPEAQLLAALRFVQDDVRYLGIEMGVSSHKPHAPAQVLQQRFGDCKDKAYLLCTLLRGLNIEAYPVLNNTVYKKTLKSWLPSPSAFDHCTVYVVFNGRTYWFDPTIAYQRGRLEDISYPNYQAGLVVKPGTTELTTIPLQQRGRTYVKEIFTVKSITGPVKLAVHTTFTGSFADDVRYSFRNSSAKEIQKTYKSFYAPYFKRMDADSLAYSDDASTGAFTTREYYTIRDFWKLEDGSRKVLLEPYVINSVIKKPEDKTDRRMPFALLYPCVYDEEVEVHLPEDWPVTESTNRFGTDAFTLTCQYQQQSSDVVRLSYHYENKEDHVPADAMETYNAEWETAEKSMAFQLSDDFDRAAPAAKSLNGFSGKGFTLAYVLLGVAALGTYVYRQRHRRQQGMWD